MKKKLLFLLPTLFLAGCSLTNNQPTGMPETIPVPQQQTSEIAPTTQSITETLPTTSSVNNQNEISLDNLGFQDTSATFGKIDPFDGPGQRTLSVPTSIYIKNNSSKKYSYGPVGQDSSFDVRCGDNVFYNYRVEGYDLNIAANGIFDTSSLNDSRMNFDCEKIFGFTSSEMQDLSLISPSNFTKSIDIECGLYLYDKNYKETKVSSYKVKAAINYAIRGDKLICELN